MKKDNSAKIILDLCGGTGAWSNPYRDAGYDVRVITLPYQDVLAYQPPDNVYGIMAAPPCTKFSKANWRVKKVDRDFKEGMSIVKGCMDIIWAVQEKGALLKFWALENPMGYLYNFMGFPYFYFQPWQFGDTSYLATKRTALWGYFNKPPKTVQKRTVPFISAHNKRNGQRPCNTEWSSFGKNNRAEMRAITPPGFAAAFFKANR